MAHVHGAAAAATTASEHAMMGHGAASLGAKMAEAGTGHMMANMPRMSAATLATGAAAAGAAVAATTNTGRSFMSLLFRHPLLVFSAGVATGYLIHKYRREIIATATLATERSKDFVLHQKENLEDLVAECKECADDEGEAKKS